MINPGIHPVMFDCDQNHRCHWTLRSGCIMCTLFNNALCKLLALAITARHNYVLRICIESAVSFQHEETDAVLLVDASNASWSCSSIMKLLFIASAFSALSQVWYQLLVLLGTLLVIGWTASLSWVSFQWYHCQHWAFCSFRHSWVCIIIAMNTFIRKIQWIEITYFLRWEYQVRHWIAICTLWIQFLSSSFGGSPELVTASTS